MYTLLLWQVIRSLAIGQVALVGVTRGLLCPCLSMTERFLPLFTRLPLSSLLGFSAQEKGIRRGPRFLYLGRNRTWPKRSSGLVRYLEEDDFVALYVRYRLVTGLR
jgi:hypothetical protein